MNVPPRYSRVDPWVISDNTEAEIAFLEAAIQAYETPGSRMLGPDGRIGHVEAVDRAVEAGARLLTQPTESAFGEREARVRDPQGHLWWVHERFEDVAPADLAQRFADPGAQQAMAYVQDSLTNEPSRARYAIPAERSCGWWRCPCREFGHRRTPSSPPKHTVGFAEFADTVRREATIGICYAQPESAKPSLPAATPAGTKPNHSSKNGDHATRTLNAPSAPHAHAHATAPSSTPSTLAPPSDASTKTSPASPPTPASASVSTPTPPPAATASNSASSTNPNT